MNRNSAEVAKALVLIVLEEVEKRKRENYGYTAEQIVSKLKRDSSADAIVSHLLKKTNPLEAERLLLKIIPEHYAIALEDDTPAYALPALTLCFRTAFNQASDGTKQKTVEGFVKVFREESDEVISTYVIPFLRCSDLKYVPTEDADMVIQHLLGNLQNRVDPILLAALDEIGKYLSKHDVAKFVDPLIRTICLGQDASLKKSAQALLSQGWLNVPSIPDDEDLVIKRLNEWIAFYKERDNEQLVARVEQIKAAVYDSIPF